MKGKISKKVINSVSRGLLTPRWESTSLKNWRIKITYPTQHPKVKKKIKKEINFAIFDPKSLRPISS